MIPDSLSARDSGDAGPERLRSGSAVKEIATPERAGVEGDPFFTLSLDMLCICGFDGRFRRLNPAWKRTLGFEIEELVAEPFINLVHPDDRERTMVEFEKILAGASVLDFENRYRCRDGSHRWLVWSATPVSEAGTIYAVARDITERRGAEEAMRRSRDAAEAANKELQAFSYSVSHDLRAPLRSIDGFSQALLEDCSEMLDDKARQHLQRVRSAAQRMSHLIDDLLILSRLTLAEMRMEKVHLSELASRIAEELARLQPERRVEFVVQEGAVAEGDPRLLRVALENLLENAWKYTKKRAVAHIEVGMTQTNAGRPTYFVRDDGAGFDMAYAGKLFGAFQRLHPSEEFEGTGMGLATVARIIHRHGGRIWAEGVVEKGATFYFTL